MEYSEPRYPAGRHGFDVSSGQTFGLGIRSMRERVRLVGGSFRVDSHSGAGTKIEANVLMPRITPVSALDMAG